MKKQYQVWPAGVLPVSSVVTYGKNRRDVQVGHSRN